MTDSELSSIPPRSGPGFAAARDSKPIPHSATRTGDGSQQRGNDGDVDHLAAHPRGAVLGTQPLATDDATRFPASSSGGNFVRREHHTMTAGGARAPQPTGFSRVSMPSDYPSTADNSFAPSMLRRQQPALSRSGSEGTASTNGADPVFKPPANGGRLSPGTGSAHGSSQESQLLQLSQIAATQERIPEEGTAHEGNGPSRKRMADGMVKHTREKSNVSPGQMAGHSRNTSTVSVASTAGSRIGELSAELKTRLSYAMVKVNHGWQSHSIDQVETLASQATSPASTASTIHLRNESSASPQLSAVSHRGSNNTTPAFGPPHSQYSGRPGGSQWRESPQSTSRGSSASPVKTSHGLAPPVSIQPSHRAGNPRREPNPRHAPPFLSNANHHNTSPRAGLHTSPYLGPGRQHRTAMGEAMLASPHTTVREQDAIESLLFMSSPGNSANLKHAFPSSSSQPLPASHAAPSQRTALPTSQPRKSLPSGRPPHHARSQSHSHPQTTGKRFGLEKSPSAMDIDEQLPLFGGSPMSRGTPRRRINGSHGEAHATHAPPPAVPRPKHMPVSAGLTVSSKPRPTLADEDIDRMLDRAAAAAEEDSESEGEIRIPVPRARRDGAGVVEV